MKQRIAKIVCALFGHWYGLGSFQTFAVCRRCGAQT
jgi:hypothetical protein